MLLLFFKFNLFFFTISFSDGMGLAKADCPNEFDKCLATYLPDYKTADMKSSKDLLYFLDLSPATWNRICTNAFWIAQCMDDTGCFSSSSQFLYLSGIKDFIIVICEYYENTNLKEIYECSGKEEFMKEISSCFESVPPTCESKEKEARCVKRIDRTPRYCIGNYKMTTIYLSLFSPWVNFLVKDCNIKNYLWKNCNEVVYSKCTESINKFHEDFLNEIDGESPRKRIDRVQRLCEGIKSDEECLTRLNCLKGSRQPYLTAKVRRLLKSATSFCAQDLRELANCSPDLGRELDKCYIKPHVEITQCEYFNTIKVCYYKTTKKETCFKPEVFAEFTSELINPLTFAFQGGIPYCPIQEVSVLPSDCMNKFTSCLNDLKGGSDELFLDFSNSNLFHHQLSTLLKIDPATWENYCKPSLYERHLDCFAEANCYEKNPHLYGVRDLVIYACQLKQSAFQRISQCAQMDEFLSSLSECLTGLNNCGVGQQEQKCVTDLGKNREYCCNEHDLEEMFVTFFQPKYSSKLVGKGCQLSSNTALVLNPCNEMVHKTCSPALGEFHEELWIERKRASNTKFYETAKRNFKTICKEIENSKQCLIDAKCFDDNIYNKMYFKGLWDSADYLCKERLEDLDNIISCYDLKDMKSIDEENDNCQANTVRRGKSKCVHYQDINVCMRQALNKRNNCFNVEAYSYFFSLLWLPRINQEDPDCKF